MRRAALALALAVGTGVGTSCAPSGLLFHQDRRVRIDSPTRSEKLQLPVTVRWSLRPGAGDAGDIHSYGVFFDADPPPAGKTLAYIARSDKVCQRTPGCPDPTYLASRGIFQTEELSLRIDRLRPAGGQGKLRSKRQPHEVTIVALDRSGRRVNEAAWSRSFVIEAGDS